MILYSGHGYSAPEMTVIRHAPDTDHPLPRSLHGAIICLGNFDGLHLGHQAVLAAATTIAAREARPLAMMSCEPHPRSFFGTSSAFRLSSPAQKHMRFRDAGVDYLFEPAFDAAFAGQAPEDFLNDLLLKRLRIGGIVCGTDFRFGAKRAGDTTVLVAFCQSHGLRHFVVEKNLPASSTGVRQAILAGDFTAAERQLGEEWQLDLHAQGLQLRPEAGRYLVRHEESRQSFEVEIDADGAVHGTGPVPIRFLRLIRRLD